MGYATRISAEASGQPGDDPHRPRRRLGTGGDGPTTPPRRPAPPAAGSDETASDRAAPSSKAWAPASAGIESLAAEWRDIHGPVSHQRAPTSLERLRSREARRIADLVQALYRAEDETCHRLVAWAAGDSGSPQDLARMLLGPAARLTGEHWAADLTDFLRVTMAVSKLTCLFREACLSAPPSGRYDPRRRMLLAPAPGNQHGFGLCVAEDAFRRDGWLVEGGDTASEVLDLVARHPYRIIGLSIGTEHDLAGLRNFVTALKQRSRNPSVALMAGGCLAASHPAAIFAAGFDLVPTDVAMATRQAAAIADGRALLHC